MDPGDGFKLCLAKTARPADNPSTPLKPGLRVAGGSRFNEAPGVRHRFEEPGLWSMRRPEGFR